MQAVKRTGADPVLIDCDPDTFQADPDDFKRRARPGTKAVILVHTFGMPAPASQWLGHGLPVIEDIATAIGATRNGSPVGVEGCCAVCSFHATKMITSGSGGAVMSADRGLTSRVLDLVEYDARGEVLYNERMGEMAAALGRSQLARLDSFLRRRSELADFYREALAESDLVLPPVPYDSRPAWHRFVVRVPGGAERVRLVLKERGISSPPPVHQPLHRILGIDGYKGAETAHKEALSLPLYPSLEDEDARFIADQVRKAI